MKIEKLIYLFLMAVALISCSVDPVAGEDEYSVATVTLNLGASPQTKGISSLAPEVENLIHDIWVIQFNSAGQTLDRFSKHYRTDAAGQMSVTGLQLNLAALDNSTVCIVANLGDEPFDIPDNFPAFQRMKIPVDVEAANNGTMTRMPMTGYYSGPTTDGQSLNVTLGRLLARINVIVTNSSGAVRDIPVSLVNVPGKAHVFPMKRTEVLTDSDYYSGDIQDSLTSFAVNESVSLCYYVAPNLTAADGRPTTIYFNLPSSKKRATVVLGNDIPSAANRDCNLYMNTYYTFNITLKATSFKAL